MLCPACVYLSAITLPSANAELINRMAGGGGPFFPPFSCPYAWAANRAASTVNDPANFIRIGWSPLVIRDCTLPAGRTGSPEVYTDPSGQRHLSEDGMRPRQVTISPNAYLRARRAAGFKPPMPNSVQSVTAP